MSIILVKNALNCVLKKKIQLHKMSLFKTMGKIFEEMLIDINYFFSINFDESAKSHKTVSFRAQREILHKLLHLISQRFQNIYETINFLLVCFLHCLREKEFELVAIKIAQQLIRNGIQGIQDKIRTDF